ncbi:MAG TPA: phosphoribosyltransferase [Aquifex aeolicus]|uniref:Phosphoribosyltransferase n=1 Tax=Aquifex aeolicus TaxID=63363 RepID=A0A9D1CEW1_AQUAO|nr:phosphoribosyltransferase [Aquificales bacterium]HIP86799.1 phosphoribosyltransferase [Aquifex sp.]HIP98290.1 phosphoribosyltransferase [Aquifex aeolicus]HIQ25865.1 phosphoribosyltransferase [Aquifex aeolicus]
MFKDRTDAGRKLAQFLKEFVEGKDPLVLALPRGGVPVAFEVALGLSAKFSILPVRKLGVPSNPELAFGALDPDGEVYLNPTVVESFGLTPEVIEEVKEKELRELYRRINLYLGGKLPNLSDREVFIIDDGFATGYTALAGCRFVSKRNPYRVVLAAPVASESAVVTLRENCNGEIAILEIPPSFFAVGMFYEDFHQLSDEEVLTYKRLAKEMEMWEGG